jgi:class 3 adenylate cyclase
VNVAKRLQEQAPPGEILITQEVCTELGDLVQAESVGELTIKGRQQPVRVFRLLALS